MKSTIVSIREFPDTEVSIPLPVFFCGECGDLFVFASVVSASNQSKDEFEQLHVNGDVKDQKPRFCPQCGTKNKRVA